MTMENTKATARKWTTWPGGPLTEEAAKATIEHLYAQITNMQKDHEARMTAQRDDHNKDCHRRNEQYGALQRQLFAS